MQKFIHEIERILVELVSRFEVERPLQNAIYSEFEDLVYSVLLIRLITAAQHIQQLREIDSLPDAARKISRVRQKALEKYVADVKEEYFRDAARNVFVEWSRELIWMAFIERAKESSPILLDELCSLDEFYDETSRDYLKFRKTTPLQDQGSEENADEGADQKKKKRKRSTRSEMRPKPFYGFGHVEPLDKRAMRGNSTSRAR